MVVPTFSLAHVDYIEGRYALPSLGADMPQTIAPIAFRRMFRINRVGRIEQPFGSAAAPAELGSVDVLLGLYAFKIPLAFLVSRNAEGMSIHAGVWADPGRGSITTAQVDAWSRVLRGLLAGVHPTLDVTEVTAGLPGPAAHGVIALGTPSLRMTAALPGNLPMDRLLRSWLPSGDDMVTNEAWSALVLADPIDESVISGCRGSLMEEALELAAVSQSARAEVPLYTHYSNQLDILAERMRRGLADGAWRTAVYLLGDARGLARVASSWKSVFQGPTSLPDAIRLVHDDQAVALASAWALPDIPGVEGPGAFRHPFAWQSFLTSAELANYVHLPSREIEGLAVRPVTYFNVVAKAPPAREAVTVGTICELRRRTAKTYGVGLGDLKRHALIVGMTGSGKTNTVKQLLAQIDAKGVPFLVVEPAKKEYRELLGHPPLADRLQVWTLGNERVAPVRLNPFEFEPGTPVGVHLDLLRSLFTASFGLWTPLPQILEQCLYEIYRERGWQIASSENPGSSDETRDLAFPTLTDLVAAVEKVTAGLGYESEFTSTARAALTTRLNSLRAGAKGLMLDVPMGIPFDVFLRSPTVIELEDVGDDDDKAFLTGLLLLRLAEYRRAAGPRKELGHVMVFEEAHRLFSRVAPGGGEDEARPRAKAVETFVSMLAEIRAYGQGVVVAEQSPTKLAPDVIKNTSLKVCHRLIDWDDRMAAAGAMAMSDEQARSLTGLRCDHGEVIVFGEGDEAPISAQVDEFKVAPPGKALDELARSAWSRTIGAAGLEAAYLSFPSCASLCHPVNPLCAEERRAAGDGDLLAMLERLLLAASAAEDAALVEEAARSVLAEVRRHLSRTGRLGSDGSARLRCAIRHGLNQLLLRHARHGDWPMHILRDVLQTAAGALSAAAMAADAATAAAALAEAGAMIRAASQGSGPFPQCARICGDVCLFRFAAESWPMPAGMPGKVRDAVQAIGEDPGRARDLIEDAVFRSGEFLLPFRERQPAQWRAGFCSVLHEIERLDQFRWEDRSEIATSFLEFCPQPHPEDL